MEKAWQLLRLWTIKWLYEYRVVICFQTNLKSWNVLVQHGFQGLSDMNGLLSIRDRLTCNVKQNYLQPCSVEKLIWSLLEIYDQNVSDNFCFCRQVASQLCVSLEYLLCVYMTKRPLHVRNIYSKILKIIPSKRHTIHMKKGEI